MSTPIHQPELHLPAHQPKAPQEIRLPGEERCEHKRSCEKCAAVPSKSCLRCHGRGYYFEEN